jgi:hypothetical protein
MSDLRHIYQAEIENRQRENRYRDGHQDAIREAIREGLDSLRGRKNRKNKKK